MSSIPKLNVSEESNSTEQDAAVHIPNNTDTDNESNGDPSDEDVESHLLWLPVEVRRSIYFWNKIAILSYTRIFVNNFVKLSR